MPTPIDAYLDRLDHPAARKTLLRLRAQLRKLLPGATETISYGMPAFRHESGKVAAGFAFFGKHCGYYPHSGSVVHKVGKQLAGYKTSAGGVTFPPDKPLPAAAVQALVKVRLEEIARAKSKKKAAKKRAAKKKAATTATKKAARRKVTRKRPRPRRA